MIRCKEYMDNNTVQKKIYNLPRVQNNGQLTFDSRIMVIQI